MKAIKLLILIPYLILQIINCFGQHKATVIRVIDGDTYQVLQNKRVFTARLANVDTPEIKQSFGIAAKDSVRKLILGKSVVLESLKNDRYNRVIVQITIEGKALDSIMVVNGWAWHYKEYSYKQELSEMQEMAIKTQKGLWKCGLDKVCSPAVFRGLNAKNRAKYCKGCIY